MSKNIYLGIDIGATKTIFLLAEFNGAEYKILESVKLATFTSTNLKLGGSPKEKEILEMVEENYKALPEKNKISGIGIGFAGPVDFERGAAIMGPNLKTGKIEFKKILEKKLGIPMAVDNDARCFTLAESVFGAARKYKNIVGLTIGTGVGGGIIIDGKIYRGATGSAGEFGHTEIFKSKELEEAASGSGLVKIYKKISGRKLTSFEIIDLAKKKDIKALEAVNFVGESLGAGIANIIESFNPEIVVIGGGLSEVDLIISKAKEVVKNKLFLPSLAKTPIVVSRLGQNAVALGAAWMASLK